MPNINADVEGPASGVAGAPPGAGEPFASSGGAEGTEAGPSPSDRAFKNGGFAGNQNVVSMIKRQVLPRIDAIRGNRAALEETWAEAWRTWMMVHSGRGYVGRSNLYIPVVRKALETVIAMLSSGLFPTDDIVDVNAGPKADDTLREIAVQTKDQIQFDLLHVAKLKQEAKSFVRQLVVAGTSPMKVYWKTVKARVSKRAYKDMVIMGRAIPVGGAYEDEVFEYNGPVVSVRDLFNWYIWPEKSRSVEEAEIVFEVMEVSAAHLRMRARDGVYHKDAVEEAIKAGGQIQGSSVDSEFEANKGLSLPSEASASHEGAGEDGEPNTPVRILEIWCRVVFPDGKERGFERGEPEPAVITVAGGDIILRACPNPFQDKKPPYVVGRLNETVQGFYGTGLGVVGTGLQKLCNDQANQAIDTAAFCINPIVKRSLAGAKGPLPSMRPGVVWNCMNPNDIQIIAPPWELAQAGISGAQTSIGMAYDFLSAPPILQGNSPVGRGAKTARGMGILQSNSMTPLQDIVEDLEQQVFVSILEKTAHLERQFRGLPFPVEDLIFRWLASKTAMNQQVRANQMVQLLQIAGSFMPLLQLKGKIVDAEPLLKQLITDGFGMRNADQIIINGPPVPMGGPGAPPGGQGPAPSAPSAPAPGMDSGDDSNMMAQVASLLGGNGQMGSEGGGGVGPIE